jgi:hypothetical protein
MTSQWLFLAFRPTEESSCGKPGTVARSVLLGLVPNSSSEILKYFRKLRFQPVTSAADWAWLILAL